MRILLFLLFSLQLAFAANVHAQDVYRLNPGDTVRISVWNEEQLQQEATLLPDGTISFPLVGSIAAAKKTTGEIEKIILQKLSRVIPDPEITVSVISVAGNNIYVIGQVNEPGQISLTTETDVVQALSLAGGFTGFAKMDNIRILRRTAQGQVVIKFDYTKIEDGKALDTNILLESGDTIVVP